MLEFWAAVVKQWGDVVLAVVAVVLWREHPPPERPSVLFDLNCAPKSACVPQPPVFERGARQQRKHKQWGLPITDLARERKRPTSVIFGDARPAELEGTLAPLPYPPPWRVQAAAPDTRR